MSEAQVISFDLTLERVHVNLKNVDGSERKCYLQEFDGFKRDKYINKESTKVNTTKKTLNDFTDVQAMLLAETLYDAATDELIPIAEIRQFPAKVQTSLHELAATLNGFDKQANEDTAKNA